MRQPIPLRLDYDAPRLRWIARESEDADQVRRLLALAVIDEGGSRTEAAEVGGVTLQVVRDWVLRFNAHGPEGLIDRKAPGQPSRLNDEHRAALVAMVENGPIPAVHEVVRWRIIDLCQWLWDEYEITVSKQTLSRELRAMGYRKLSARPRHHAQAAGAVEAFKKTGLRQWRRSRAGVALIPPIWRSGSATKPGSARRTRSPVAGQGVGPSAPSDQRTTSTYIFGAICPREGKAVGLILPWCNTAMMNLHLAAISADVAPGKHAVLLLDQAGWHLSHKLVVPPNITIVPLPPKCPELNPQENIWQFMRDNWLSNRVFDNDNALIDHCCDAWNKLEAQPWTIMSIGLRDWAHRF